MSTQKLKEDIMNFRFEIQRLATEIRKNQELMAIPMIFISQAEPCQCGVCHGCILREK